MSISQPQVYKQTSPIGRFRELKIAHSMHRKSPKSPNVSDFYEVVIFDTFLRSTIPNRPNGLCQPYTL